MVRLLAVVAIILALLAMVRGSSISLCRCQPDQCRRRLSPKFAEAANRLETLRPNVRSGSN